MISEGCIAGAAACVFGGYTISNHYQKKAILLQSSALLQQEFSFDNGSSLAIGVDMMRDNAVKTDAWVSGLKYNF